PGMVPILVPGANIQPAPTLEATTDLLPCADAPPPPVCPNGVTETGEECDDNNTTACDGCSASCVLEGCGNGMIECEACDDGNVADGDGCDASCHVEAPATCGDGTIDEGEECDSGNTTDCDGDGCSHLCLDEGCGNNRLECAEVCDDGGTLPCDGDCA